MSESMAVKENSRSLVSGALNRTQDGYAGLIGGDTATNGSKQKFHT
jgi:hypothetical protein